MLRSSSPPREVRSRFNILECLLASTSVGNEKRYTVIEGKKTISFFDSIETRVKIVDICKKWLSVPYGFSKYEDFGNRSFH